MKKFIVFVMAISVFMFSSCNKPKLITLAQTSKTMHYGETYVIHAECENPISYSSNDEYHAKVTSSGKITAQYVGNTTIRLTSEDDTKTFSVVVEPEYNTYPEPRIKFGDTKSSVISKLGEPDYIDADGIGYTNYSSKAPILAILFDDNEKVESYGILVKTAFSSELASFLGERYVYVGETDDFLAFTNGLTAEKKTMFIGLELYNVNYWMVAYAPYNNKDIENIQSIEKRISIFVK